MTKNEPQLKEKNDMLNMETKKDLHFENHLSMETLNEPKFKDIFDGIHFLITNIAAPINPMANGDIPVWSWGTFVINEIIIPAPYSDHGFTANGTRVALTEEMSAITNTFVWLDFLLSLKRLPPEQLSAIDGMFLPSSLDWIDFVGDNKVREIVSILRNIAANDCDGRWIID